ncbi:MAG: UDP-N-acetylmuramoyl-L-alanyl-D-glutamate--2,6-diaminopimelate ligase [Halarsenatibacteraceae bacterium]
MLASSLYDRLDFFTDKIGDFDFVIKDIVHDSREADKNKIFLAREGFNTDGHDYINDAYKNGSRVFIVKRIPDNIKNDALYLKVKNPAEVLGLVAAEIFNHPEREVDLLGVTGTNGKTTTTYMLKSFFETAGFKTGLIGTIEIDDGDNSIESQRTTPEASDIIRYLREMAENGCKKVVMEVSSHALSLNRIQGLSFSSVIFTNISRDHLDFHDSFKEYLKAKLKLLNYLQPEGRVYYNKDDKRLRNSFENIKGINKYNYSINRESDYRAENIKLYQDKIEYELNNKKFKLNMSGKFNVYNVISASAVILGQEIEIDSLAKAVSDFKGVPGRFEYIKNDADIIVLVDYAHTPAGIRNVLNSINEFKNNKVIAVFGCGGDRDKEKRPEMGIIGYELADKIILTSDNPRSEDPKKIIQDIEAGIIEKYPDAEYEKVLNRSEAINKAIINAEENNIIIIFGKGHETYQEFADKIIDFDDREVASQALKQRSEGR